MHHNLMLVYARQHHKAAMLGYSSAAAFIPVEHTDKKTMKASVYIAVTVDGYIAEKNGSVDFLNEYQSSASAADGDMGFADFLDTVDLLIMGRKTSIK